MARGWESKTIESQQDDAAATAVDEAGADAERSASGRSGGTRSSCRGRALPRTSTARPRRRTAQMLEQALADLDAQLGALG